MDIFIPAVSFSCVALLAFAIWKSRQPRRYFTIRLQDGEPRATQGNVSNSVIAIVREVAKFNSVRDGQIWAVPGPSGMRLQFSKSITEGARRQMLKSWGAMGWKTASMSGSRR